MATGHAYEDEVGRFAGFAAACSEDLERTLHGTSSTGRRLAPAEQRERLRAVIAVFTERRRVFQALSGADVRAQERALDELEASHAP